MKGKIRLLALDGLRGVAILLVILNHIPLKAWYDSINPFFYRLLDVLLVNGKVGVSILFLLTGFLMAWLYPRPKSSLSFWVKRYARLFPAFLVMVTSLTIIKVWGDLSILEEILVVLGVGLIARILWQLGLMVGKKVAVGKILTGFWICLQIGVAIWYVFYLQKIASPIFYETWNKNLQWIITGIINGTLTLPFGNYIGQLDGVYWSLITETLFYILYPILFVPIFTYVNRKKSVKWKTFLLIFSFVFCFGLGILSKRILWMGMMIPYLMIYFVVGVMLGSNLEWWQKQILKLPKIVFNPLFLILFFLISFSGVFIYPYIAEVVHPWIQMIIVIPLGFLVAGATLEKKTWGGWLENRFLVFLGKYSYALYLTHALIIDLMVKIFPATSLVNSLWLLMGAILGSIGLAWCLYHLIEAPYYRLEKVSLNMDGEESWLVVKRKFKKTFSIFILVIVFILILAFKTPFSLFTYSYFEPTKNKESIWLTGGENIQFEFDGKENSLGMTTINIKSIKKMDEKDSVLNVKFKDGDNKLISESNFNTKTMIENNFYPLGFPIQENSKGKKYRIEYQIKPEESFDKVEIDQKENKMVSVYFLNKKDLIKNFKMGEWWLLSKIREPFLNPLFWQSLLLVMPLILVLGVGLRKNEK